MNTTKLDCLFVKSYSLAETPVRNEVLALSEGFFFLLGTAVISSLWQALLAQRRRRSRVMQGLGFASVMGICSILIHSFADFNLHITANSLWFVLLLAFAWVAVAAEEGP